MHRFRIGSTLCLSILLGACSVQATEGSVGRALLLGAEDVLLTPAPYSGMAYPYSDLWSRQSPTLAAERFDSTQRKASPQEANGTKKSPKRAFLLSLLLPGAGQYYVQGSQKAKLFLGVESTLWALFLGFRTYRDWREADYNSFAMEHTGVDPTGQSDEYLDDLGFYTSASEYNRYAQREAGPEAELYTNDEAWEWDSTASRLKYKGLRRSSLLAHSRATYVLGALLVHRAFSAIHAARLARIRNEGFTKHQEYIKLDVTGWEVHQPTVRLSLLKHF
jgi:hypothetical protein